MFISGLFRKWRHTLVGKKKDFRQNYMIIWEMEMALILKQTWRFRAQALVMAISFNFRKGCCYLEKMDRFCHRYRVERVVLWSPLRGRRFVREIGRNVRSGIDYSQASCPCERQSDFWPGLPLVTSLYELWAGDDRKDKRGFASHHRFRQSNLRKGNPFKVKLARSQHAIFNQSIWTSIHIDTCVQLSERLLISCSSENVSQKMWQQTFLLTNEETN